MSGKVKVSREVANFFKKCEGSGDPNWEDAVLHEHIKIFENKHGDEEVEVFPDALCMLKYSPFELARILVLGWEVEETPEEKFIKQYDKFLLGKTSLDIEEGKTAAYGMKVAIEILGIQIEGINK